jgi:hypothetical protein
LNLIRLLYRKPINAVARELDDDNLIAVGIHSLKKHCRDCDFNWNSIENVLVSRLQATVEMLWQKNQIKKALDGVTCQVSPSKKIAS